ncbi:Rrf2 family transcriptional regulator [Clostridium boliviensis]|uniref:Rrf2 family transcriptional regulator n=1 Tax=Clostridium boliviensis TaxID=318465 RepID=A0ABU4GNF4_9CLOT|nr:Rrf2 family transcriptional regulator [Clostridium boliviensis]MDW2799151.1 Rrf2 family transcriptional regulator [Clostridium boliviensis]
MKFSTKGRYALRMMIEFALRPGECTKINHVAERQDISDKYLEQIVTILSRAGYVKSRRGAQGGYYLTKDPSEYTVGMILRLAEGSLVPVSCMEEEVNSCSRADICASMIVWKKLDQAISDVVDSITLADLVTEQKRLEGIEG